MASEDIITISWDQLPQRDCWKRSNFNHKSSTTNNENEDESSDFKITPASIPAGKPKGDWEYLDHTADVQIHSWGKNIEDAFGAAVVGMSAYMVEISQLGNDLQLERTVQAHDLQSLLYTFMDECLYIFHTEGFVVKEAIITDFDMNSWSLKAQLKGGMFDGNKTAKGTEVKAITYSNMQILTHKDKVEVYVIVDI